MIRDVWEHWQPAWVGIEDQAATKMLFIEAQREGVVVNWLHPIRNKISRAETAAALLGAGRIYFPERAPWLGEFEDELLTFPVGAHDDQVDCLSYAGIQLAAGTVRARHRRYEPQSMEERHWQSIRDRERRRHRHPVLGSC
jgi:predicted phage terminase large subunit-like protein